MRTRDLASSAGGLAALATAVLAVGGAPRWSQAIVAALAAIALASLVASRRRLARVSPLLAVLGVAAGLTALQLVPLPTALLEWLNPTGVALRNDGLELASASAPSTVTMDFPNSLRALTMFVTLLGIAVVALRRASSERGRYQLAAAVCGTAGISAVVVGIHELFGLRALYGLYPISHGPHLIGPLLNLNHLGCLMAIGAVTGIGLAAYGRQAAWLRIVWLVISAACGSVTLATVSRGATLALLAGGFVTVSLLLAQRFSSHDRRARGTFWIRSLPIGVIATCAVAAVIYSNAGAIEQKLDDTSLDELASPMSKYEAWRSSTQLIQEAPLLGVGRGGSEPSLTRVHPASGQMVFSFLENEYLQAAVDWGVIGAIVLGLAGAWLAYVAIRRWRDGPIIAAALGGLVVVVLQSAIDFGVELLGLAAPATVLAAVVTYVPLVEEPTTDARRVLRIGHVVMLLACAGLLLSNATTTIAEDHERLQRGGDAGAIHASIARHPLDYYGYAVAAELAFRRGDPKGVRLLNHALRLNPSHGGLHRLAAKRLQRGGFMRQAAIEYAAAMHSLKDPSQLVAEVVHDLPAEHVAAAIPTDHANPRAIVTALGAAQHPELAQAWLLRVLAREPDHVHACELLLGLVQAPGATAGVLPAMRACPNAFTDASTLLRIAQALARDERTDDMLVVLANVSSSTGTAASKYRAWSMLCDAHRAARRWDDATSCLRSLATSGGLSAAQERELETRLELIRRQSSPATP